MNGVLPFIPKQDHELPDSYGATIYYVNGKKDEFELVSHEIVKEFQILSYVTKEDIWGWVPVSSIQRIEFDKRWSQVVDINRKRNNENKKVDQ